MSDAHLPRRAKPHARVSVRRLQLVTSRGTTLTIGEAYVQASPEQWAAQPVYFELTPPEGMGILGLTWDVTAPGELELELGERAVSPALPR